MDTLHSTAPKHLAENSLLKLRDAQGSGVVVLSGRLWITQDGDPRDLIVEAGESVRLDRAGLTIMQALAETRLRLLDPIVTSARLTRPSTVELTRQAQRQRSAAIGDLVLRLLRRPWARA